MVVVGAGPAGATAARTLARPACRCGCSIASAFPRNKPCGGGISARVAEAVSVPGAGTSGASRRTPSAACISRGRRGVDGRRVGQPAALMIRRIEFDALLVVSRRRSGRGTGDRRGFVQASTSATMGRSTARDGRRFEAPLVVAADGVHSVIAQAAGPESRLGAACGRARHDGRNAALDAARHRSVDDVGGLRLRPAEVTKHSEPRSKEAHGVDARRRKGMPISSRNAIT